MRPLVYSTSDTAYIDQLVDINSSQLKSAAATILESYASLDTKESRNIAVFGAINYTSTIAVHPGAKNVSAPLNMIPEDRIIAKCDALLVEAGKDGMPASPHLETTRHFTDFAQLGKAIQMVPKTGNLFINSLRTQPAYNGFRIGHTLLRALEERTQPYETFIYCHPYTKWGLRLTDEHGMERLESYYQDYGFEPAFRNNEGYLLMKKRWL